jgi:hypothetical protein
MEYYAPKAAIVVGVAMFTVILRNILMTGGFHGRLPPG